MDLKSVTLSCRLCFSECASDSVNIFDEGLRSPTYSAQVMEMFQIEVSSDIIPVHVEYPPPNIVFSGTGTTQLANKCLWELCGSIGGDSAVEDFHRYSTEFDPGGTPECIHKDGKGDQIGD